MRGLEAGSWTLDRLRPGLSQYATLLKSVSPPQPSPRGVQAERRVQDRVEHPEQGAEGEVPGQERHHVPAAVAPVREARMLRVDHGVVDREDGAADGEVEQAAGGPQASRWSPPTRWKKVAYTHAMAAASVACPR